MNSPTHRSRIWLGVLAVFCALSLGCRPGAPALQEQSSTPTVKPTSESEATTEKSAPESAPAVVSTQAPTPTWEAEPTPPLKPQPTEEVVPPATKSAAAAPSITAPTAKSPNGTKEAATPPVRPHAPEATLESEAKNEPDARFIQVSAGSFHTCGLRADGTITCWGAHGEDERRIDATGLLDSPPGDFSQIDAGHQHSCAIRQDGAVECWGGPPWGEIVGSDAPPEALAAMEAMLAPPEGRFKSLSAGFLFSCGVRADDSAECWGLAVSSFTGALDPPDGEYIAVAAGGFHACGIRTDQP